MCKGRLQAFLRGFTVVRRDATRKSGMDAIPELFGLIGYAGLSNSIAPYTHFNVASFVSIVAIGYAVVLVNSPLHQTCP
jgi:hypothetical protein